MIDVLAYFCLAWNLCGLIAHILLLRGSIHRMRMFNGTDLAADIGKGPVALYELARGRNDA